MFWAFFYRHFNGITACDLSLNHDPQEPMVQHSVTQWMPIETRTWDFWKLFLERSREVGIHTGTQYFFDRENMWIFCNVRPDHRFIPWRTCKTWCFPYATGTRDFLQYFNAVLLEAPTMKEQLQSRKDMIWFSTLWVTLLEMYLNI